MAARIEAFLYSENSASAMEHTSALTAGGSTVVLSAPKVFTDALAEWQSDLGGGYVVEWIAASNAVRVRSGGAFVLAFTGNLHKCLGFSAASGHSGQSTYTGDVQALGRYDVLKIELDTLTDAAAVDLRQYRHRRAEAMAYGNHDLYQSRVWMTAAQASSYLASYCAAGKVRLYQTTDDLTAYSATNVDGYIDGWILAVSDLQTHGFTEEIVSVSLVIARSKA